MKILFVVKQTKIEPLGVMYLSAVAWKAGCTSRIVDIKRAVHRVTEWKPDIVAYSVMTGDQKTFFELDKQLRRIKDFKSIWGGPHPSFFPEDFPGEKICRGEGEQWLWEYLTHTLFPEGHIPWPDRTSFQDSPIRHFITTRGCPYNCAYCYNQKWAKLNPELKRVRTRDVDDVIAEINSTDAQFVYFQDDCFGIDKNWLKEFTEKYEGPEFHCHVRPNMVTVEYACLLAAAGCKSVHMAVESADPHLRNQMLNRDMSLIDVQYACLQLEQAGIKVMLQNMIGIPTGTVEDDLATLRFNIKVNPAYSWVSIYQPYPGTPLGDLCKERGYYTGDYSDIGPSFFDTSHLNISDEYREQLEVLQKVFALCVEGKVVPNPSNLTKSSLAPLVYDIQRKIGDRRLYGIEL